MWHGREEKNWRLANDSSYFSVSTEERARSVRGILCYMASGRLSLIKSIFFFTLYCYPIYHVRI